MSALNKDEISAELIDELKKFEGLPPYDGVSNICASDGYFLASLISIYGQDMVDGANELVIGPMLESWEVKRKEFMESMVNAE